MSSVQLFNWQWFGYVYTFEIFCSIWVWAFRQIEKCCAAGVWADVLGRQHCGNIKFPSHRRKQGYNSFGTFTPELLFANQEIMTTMQLYKSWLNSIFQNLTQMHFKYYIKLEWFVYSNLQWLPHACANVSTGFEKQARIHKVPKCNSLIVTWVTFYGIHVHCQVPSSSFSWMVVWLKNLLPSSWM